MYTCININVWYKICVCQGANYGHVYMSATCMMKGRKNNYCSSLSVEVLDEISETGDDCKNGVPQLHSNSL